MKDFIEYLFNQPLALYVTTINVLGFIAMGVDKYRAIYRQWRISEKTLFLLAALGGAGGSIIGMFIFHHKTKKGYFTIGMPLILILHILILKLFIID